MNNGWVKLHRKMLEWEWYSDPNVFRLFLHCILKANHKDKKWQGKTIKRGTFITGLEVLSQETGLSVKQIRIAFDKLKSSQDVAIKTTNKFRLVTVVKYDDYQDYDSREGKLEGKQRAGKGQTKGKQRAATNNDKNKKNVKNDKNNNSIELSKKENYLDGDKLNEVIEIIYKTYPSSYIINNITKKTGKTKKNKDAIKKIVGNDLEKARELFETTKRYVEECKTSNTYLKNFSTFLNNIPDYEDETVVTLENKKVSSAETVFEILNRINP